MTRHSYSFPAGESSRDPSPTYSLLSLCVSNLPPIFLPHSTLTIYNHDNDDGLIMMLILTMVVVVVMGTNDVYVCLCLSVSRCE